MSKTTTKRNTSSRKMVTKRGTTTTKRSLPQNISMNTGGTYRVRKSINGNNYDVTFRSLKDAKAYVATLK